MTFFWKYLRGQKKVIGANLLFCVIFALVFWQYHLPPEAVLYPALLCILAGGLIFIADYGKVLRRHKWLERVSHLAAAMIDEFPTAQRIEEEDYQSIIRTLQKEVCGLEADADLRYRDMVEYYTIWAHQIKTPIASMRLHLRDEDTAVSRRLLTDLFRIEQYVEMVLAFLRLESTTGDYVFKEYSLDTILRQAVKKFSHEFIDRKIRLEYETIEKTIVTDEKWLSFVLEQIISNALKYTREGSIKIYMSGEDVLSIEDTGIGIAPEDLPRIFENGYTGYNGRTDKRASGIGLYLCKRVCDNLGIEIGARSEIGKGTILQLYINQYTMRKE